MPGSGSAPRRQLRWCSITPRSCTVRIPPAPSHFHHHSKCFLLFFAAHKHTHYTSSPVAAANLQNYWVHRQNYLSWHGSFFAFAASSYLHRIVADIATPPSTAPQAGYSQANTIYSTARGHAPSASEHGYSNHRAHSGSSSSATYHPTPGYAQPQMQMQPAPGFNTLSPHPVVVPPGFTETHPGSPGWWRNPETGWFWNASRGLLPPRDK
jgi:hypothetical protein